MKKLISLCLAVAALPLVIRAADFEGTVVMKITGARGAPQDMTFSLAKGRSRIDVSLPQGMNAAMLLDQTKEEMTILMPQQKMYMVRPMPKPDELPAPAKANDAGAVEKTGETETILGYKCEKFVSKNAEGTTQVWVTDQLGTFMGLGGGMPMGGRRGGGGPVSPGWENALRGKDAFPLRVITKGADGQETFRLDATAVDKKSLPASTFEPPADYQKFDMQGMMRGMGAPGGMRPPGGG